MPTSPAPVRHDLTPDDLSIAQRSRAIWRLVRDDETLMARLSASRFKNVVYRLHRQDDRSDPLELLGTLVAGFAALGVPETLFRRMILFLTEIVDTCYSGNAHGNIDDLDRLDFECEHRENSYEHERRLRGGHATAEQLDAEATAIEAEVAVDIVRARVLRSKARRVRAGLVTA